MSYKAPKTIEIINSPLIDLKVAGLTTVFTPNAPFLIAQIFFYSTSVVGIVSSAICNAGWTSSNYDDFLSSFSIQDNATGEFISGINNGAVYPTIPAGQAFKINVTTPETTATTSEGYFIIQGTYL
jgi:hypothetical protein